MTAKFKTAILNSRKCMTRNVIYLNWHYYLTNDLGMHDLWTKVEMIKYAKEVEYGNVKTPSNV